MKICFITSVSINPIRCGIGSYILNLSLNLLKLGHEVIIITRGGLHRTTKEYFEGLELYKCPYIPLYPFHVHIHGIFVNKLLNEIGSCFKVIHIHTPMPPPIKSSIPIVLTFHSPMKNGAKAIPITDIFSLATKLQAKYFSYPLELKLIKTADIITSVSKGTAKELEGYGLSYKKIVVTFNGVDENVFYPAMKEDWGDKYILYTGRISYGKGLFDLIDCANEVHKLHKDIRFLLAGDGPLLHELKKKVKKMNLENCVIFLGPVNRDKIVHLYQQATIFIFPSYYEGLPGSLLEAMSCALPIIATNVTGNAELIQHNHNGILVPPKDAISLCNAVIALLDDPEKMYKMGRNARKEIEETYSWEKISIKILQCYKEARK